MRGAFHPTTADAAPAGIGTIILIGNAGPALWQAFTEQSQSDPNGADCLDFGCRARHACPVGRDYRYAPNLAQFHMEAFYKARHRR